MTLETIQQRWLLIPLFIRHGDEPPRKVHWVGKSENPSGNEEHGQNRNIPEKKDRQGYRSLTTITLGEVQEAYDLFVSQLTPSPYPGWISRNNFCMIHLTQRRSEGPPAIFGQVRACYPADGYIQNIQEMELLFPTPSGAPDLVLLRAEDILSSHGKPADSYCLRVSFLMSAEEVIEFSGAEDIFTRQGFAPEFESGYLHVLEFTEETRSILPWAFVIGSRWFSTIPDSLQPEVREQLLKLIRWKKLILNYHPERSENMARSLNRELGFKPGFSDFFLLEPETPKQTVQALARAFDGIFQKDMR